MFRIKSLGSMASLVRSPLIRGCYLARFLRPSIITTVESRRGVKRYMRSYLTELYYRRLKVGPERLRHRSEWINWNYDAEIYAFGKRLGEDFSTDSLRKAFTHRSYIETEEKHRSDLGIDVAAAPMGLTDNSEFVQKGEVIASRYIKAYLRSRYPAMFEEAVVAIHGHLMSDDTLAFVANDIGIADLMLCADFPPEQSTLRNNFLAVIGALESDQGLKRAESLVRDLVIVQLIGKNWAEFWNVMNPMGILMAILHAQGRGPPESRLQWQAGQRTIMAIYQVGVYSDQRLIGQSPGETVAIAEEMAARNALQRIMGITEGYTPLAFRVEAEEMELNYDRENLHAEDVVKQYEQRQAKSSVA